MTMSTLIKLALGPGLAAVVIRALPDLRRYIEISQM